MIAEIQQAVADDPRSAKELARACGVVPRTIQNVRDGLGLPNARTLMALARAVPEVKALVARWSGAEEAGDPDQDRLLLEVLRAAQGALERRQQRLQEGQP